MLLMTKEKLTNSEIKKIFESLGFKTKVINKEEVFEWKNFYHKLTYINEEYGYVIETAEGIEEAKIDRYEDDDIINIRDTKEETIAAVIDCLKAYYLD